MRRFLISVIATLTVWSLNSAASAAPTARALLTEPSDFSPPYLVSFLTHQDDHGITGISCMATDSCAAVDSAGNALIYNGSHWTRTLVEPRDSLIAVAGFYGSDPADPDQPWGDKYMAIDATGHITLWHGSAWVRVKTTTTFPATSISCVGDIDAGGDSTCDAGDTHGNVWAISFDPAINPTEIPAWQKAPHVMSAPITSISCFVRGWCKSVDNNGEVAGDTPSPQDLDGHNQLTSISCVLSNIGEESDLCMAVDNRGNAFTHTLVGPTGSGSQWGSATATKGGNLVSVACSPEGTLCVAASAGGSVVLFDATDQTWSPAISVDSSGHLTSVTCPSASFCQASDSHGDIVQIAPIHAGVPID